MAALSGSLERIQRLFEQLLSRIVVGRTEIIIESAHAPTDSDEFAKTPNFGQRNSKGNESPQNEAPHGTNQTLNEPLMNEIAAAAFLGVSRMTLLRKRKTGEIGFYRVGFRVLYSKEKHLLPFLNRCEK